MATNDAVLKRLEQKGAEADQIIEYLKQQVALLKEKASKKNLNFQRRYLKRIHILPKKCLLHKLLL